MAEIQSVPSLALEIAQTQQNILTLEGQISAQVASFQSQLEAARKKDAELRSAILNAMEATGQTQPYEDDNIRITYVKPGTRVGVDATKLQLEQPEIYEQYKKITTVRGQVRIKVKNQL